MARPAQTGSPVIDPVRAWASTDAGRGALVDLTADTPLALTYAELVERVDALANRLRGAGVGPQQPVAVLLDRGADSVVAMLAVFAAGGAYCPVDCAAPPARVRAILDRLAAPVAIADHGRAALLPAGTVVLAPSAAGAPATAGPAPVPPPDALAYVMFTSGSTGVPKGVAMTYAGLHRLIGWQVDSGTPGLRTLQFTATYFDVTFQEILSTFVTGGCLVVVPDPVRRNPDALLDTIVGQRIERLFLPYVALQLLAVTAARRAVLPASLTHVVTAGERLIITPAIRDLFDALPGCRLDNHYGPTETHLVTSLTLPADRAAWPAVPAIGAEVAGVRCVVLDERLRAVAQGEVGELYVAGDAVARGYLGAAALTAERFVADPYGPGGRMYRTGDLVRAGTAGGYEFIGRADAQLKVRGYRVEPAEVENALLGHPRVDAAAVGLREVADGVPALVAYLQTTGPVTHRELTGHLRDLLPAYMVPSRFVTVASLPRTPSGKVDGRALAEIAVPAASEPEDAEAGGSLADTITAIWTRVLGHDEFADDDDFFDVGGDSLLATWVVAELGQALGRPVELSMLLEYGTVADLAAALGSAAPVAARRHGSQIVTLRPGPSNRSLYLVHPLGGELIGYRELCRASDAPFRLLGVGWTGQPPAPGSCLADIASVHIGQLRAIEPDGPYRLAGWSFGGVLAYEMAQQLDAAGLAVEFLGLLDANPVIDPITGLPLRDTPFLNMLDAVVARLDDPATTDADLAELTTSRTWIQLMGAPVTAGTSSGYLRQVLDTARVCMAAAMRYEPRPYPGPVHLFQAGEVDPQRRAQLAAVIRELCTGGLEVATIAGDHWTFVRGEHVGTAAAQLDAALERVGTAGRTNRGS